MLDDDAEAFLAGRTRYAMLTTIRADGSPITVPVWYAWDGERVEMFSGATSPKLTRLRRNPWASVLVANEVDEPEYWVAFDGEAQIVYEPCFTTRRDAGGSGLGMHIVHQIVHERFEGTIDLDTAPGRGTTWTLKLPHPTPALAVGRAAGDPL